MEEANPKEDKIASKTLNSSLDKQLTSRNSNSKIFIYVLISLFILFVLTLSILLLYLIDTSKDPENNNTVEPTNAVEKDMSSGYEIVYFEDDGFLKVYNSISDTTSQYKIEDGCKSVSRGGYTFGEGVPFLCDSDLIVYDTSGEVMYKLDNQIFLNNQEPSRPLL